MQRARLLLACLCLTTACKASNDRTHSPLGLPGAVDFSGTWIVKLLIVQDECGYCPASLQLDESLTIDQTQDTATAILRGRGLKATGSGSLSASALNIDFGDSVYVNSWLFIKSFTKGTFYLQDGSLNGVLFVQLGEVGPCCALCCGDGQCLCREKDCRVPLPDCKMSLVAYGTRYGA